MVLNWLNQSEPHVISIFGLMTWLQDTHSRFQYDIDRQWTCWKHIVFILPESYKYPYSAQWTTQDTPQCLKLVQTTLKPPRKQANPHQSPNPLIIRVCQRQRLQQLQRPPLMHQMLHNYLKMALCRLHFNFQQQQVSVMSSDMHQLCYWYYWKRQLTATYHTTAR